MIIDWTLSNTEIVELLKLYLWNERIKFNILEDYKIEVEPRGIQEHITVKLWCKNNQERLGWLGLQILEGKDKISY